MRASRSFSTDSKDPGAKEAVDLADALISFLPVTLDGELSAGFDF